MDDNDSKSRKLIHEIGWNIEEYIDLNHYMKSFCRKFEKYKTLSPTKFRGIKIKLEPFFQSLMHLDSTEEYKIFFWRKVVNHFSRDHSVCLKINQHVFGMALSLKVTKRRLKNL